jgi:uncharacterized membrane protein YuzA (DUF378 family)
MKISSIVSSVSGHMKYPGSRVIGRVVWLVTALAAINIGAAALGYDFFALDFMQTSMVTFIKPLMYVIGVAGVISLIMFFMEWGCNHEC